MIFLWMDHNNAIMQLSLSNLASIMQLHLQENWNDDLS